MSYIKKLIPALVLFVSFAGVSQDAEARRGHHYYGGHGYYGYGHHGYYGHRYRRHHDRSAAYLAGGLIVGSLLTHAWHRSHEPQYYRSRVYVERPTRVVRRTSTPVSRHLYRDRHGNCYEKTYRGREELLTELDPSECSW